MRPPGGALRVCPAAVRALIGGDPAPVVHPPPRTNRAHGHHAMDFRGDAERVCGVREWPSRSAERTMYSTTVGGD